MLTKEDLQAIQNLLEPIKQDIAEWVEAVESKVDSVRR